MSMIDEHVDSNMSDLISDLQTLIKVPSVSAKKQGLVECAALVVNIMNNAGINAEVLYLDHDSKMNNTRNINATTTPPPIVYGEVKSKANPNGKTILFYNRYDVQPEDPIELWDKDPYSGDVEGNYVFGRGASDDKGELITRVKAVECIVRRTGDVPCNVKFVVEGEEEIGSNNISEYLKKYKNLFACDGIIWEFGYVDEMNRPIISLGMKGLLYVELLAKGPSRDAHSSLAVLIENPAWHLVRALNTMRDNNGKILIRGWYKDVREFTPEELSLIANEPFDEEEFKKEYGIDKFVNNATGIEARKAFVGMSTCNIAGLLSGYIGEGAKTILPSEAKVKIDFRLVPDMIPEKQFELVKNHLKESGFEDDIDIKLIHGEAAVRMPPNHSFVKQVEESAKE